MPVAARALDLYHTKKVELDDVFNVSWSLDTLELGITLLDHVQQMEQRKTKGKTKAKVKLDLQSHARPPHRIYLTPARLTHSFFVFRLEPSMDALSDLHPRHVSDPSYR
jgi:hypothetical protein